MKRPFEMESDSSDAFGNNQAKIKYTRSYGVYDLILLGAGNTIGAGIFAYTGLAAKYAGGAAAWIAYVIAGLVSILTALVYAEFGSKIPKSGSSYLFAQLYQGELISWIVGWGMNLRYIGIAAPVARGWASFVVKFCKLIGFELPKWVNNYEIWGCSTSVIAPVFMLACTFIQNRGTSTSGNVNNILTGIKISILLVIISVAFCNFSYEKNFTPLVDPELGQRGIIIASTKVFFAYVGFDFITTVSEETINPVQTLPKGIMGTVAVASFLYCLTSFSVNGVGNLSVAIKKNGGDPTTALADTFSDHGMHSMSVVITIAAILGLTAVVLSNIMGQARVLRAFGKDGLLPEIFAYMDPVTKVPTKAAWISSILGAIASGCLDLDTLATLSSIGNLITYALIEVAVIQMRIKAAPLVQKSMYSNTQKFLYAYTPSAFFVISAISAASISFQWSLSVIYAMGAVLFLIYIVLQYLFYKIDSSTPSQSQEALLLSTEENIPVFLCPLVPLLPCVGMWSNLVLCAMGGNPLVWKLFSAFEFIGILIYVFYGQYHSKLGQRVKRHHERERKKGSVVLLDSGENEGSNEMVNQIN